MILPLLQQLGFTEKESDVYITILQQGKISHADIAKMTNINRTTVYAAVKQLLKMGLVYEDKSRATSYLLARPPQQLRSIVEKEKTTIKKKERVVDEALPALQALVKTPRYSIPKMIFINEDQLERYLYDQSPTWNKSIMNNDCIWWGFQDHTFAEHYHEWIDWFWKRCASRELQLQLLSNQSDIEREMKKKQYTRRHMKFWPSSTPFTGTLWVNGKYLIMIITKQRPFYLIEIHDAVMAENMRSLFQGLWNTIK